MKTDLVLFALITAPLLPAAPVFAQPVVTNRTTSVYATVPEPISLSWPAPADGWVLERTNALPAAAVLAWPQVPPPYQTNAGTISVTFTNLPATGNQFFRLHK